jgi:hypothetical protein
MVAWEDDFVQVALSRVKTLRIDLGGFGLILQVKNFPKLMSHSAIIEVGSKK